MKCGGDHLSHNAWLHQTPVCDAVLARPEEALVSLSLAINIIGEIMKIREAKDTDVSDVLLVEKEAFGYDKEANLVKDLLSDPSAQPLYSILAFENNKAIGHILFTSACWKANKTVHPYRY